MCVETTSGDSFYLATFRLCEQGDAPPVCTWDSCHRWVSQSQWPSIKEWRRQCGEALRVLIGSERGTRVPGGEAVRAWVTQAVCGSLLRIHMVT